MKPTLLHVLLADGVVLIDPEYLKERKGEKVLLFVMEN